MKKKSVFFAHFDHDKNKTHRMELKSSHETAEDFFTWIIDKRKEVEKEFGRCVIVNCGIIR